MKRLVVEIVYNPKVVDVATIMTHLRALVFRFEGLVDVNEASRTTRRIVKGERRAERKIR